MVFYGLCVFAANVDLPLFQAFDGRYNNNKGVEITEIIQPQNYFYSIKVKENPEIVAQLIELVKETGKYSGGGVTRTISEGKTSEIYYISNGSITIGVTYSADNSAISIFMQSNHPFIEDISK